MRVHIADHPLITHKLTVLRDKNTASPTFRDLTEELVTLLAYEATRNVRTVTVDIETPVAPTKGLSIATPRPLVVPILRAGIGMLDGVLSLIPGAKVSVVGVARNEETLQAHTYLERLVGEIDQRLALIVDPMLATGGSMVATIDMLKKAGCREIRALVLVAAPVGIEAVLARHPDVEIYTASIDEGLNEHGYIMPGLGDAGDRIFGTKQKTE